MKHSSPFFPWLLILAGEGYQQLLLVLQSVEAERTKQSSLVERLQERLSRAQEEISSLQSSMAQRASHYQSLHTELLDKVSQVTDTEKEVTFFNLLPGLRGSHWFLQVVAFSSFLIFLFSPQLKRKSARVAALEKQLQEKTSAYSQAALKNTELENQLQVQHSHTRVFARHEEAGGWIALYSISYLHWNAFCSTLFFT